MLRVPRSPSRLPQRPPPPCPPRARLPPLQVLPGLRALHPPRPRALPPPPQGPRPPPARPRRAGRSEEHTSELQSQSNLVCRLLLEKKKKRIHIHTYTQIIPLSLHVY